MNLPSNLSDLQHAGNAIVPSIFTEILETRFGHKNFRPTQARFLSMAAQMRDVLCILPTGEGKSLCYQIVALARPGACIVVVPLVSLMTDQIGTLRRNGISAARIDGSTPASVRTSIVRDVTFGETKFLFLSPEMVESLESRNVFDGIDVGTIVVDEAHCVLEWGESFRKSYARLGPWMDRHPSAMRIALTGSATEDSRRHVSKTLLRDGLEMVEPVDRNNIFVEVVDETPAAILERRTGQGSAILFCTARRRVDETAEALRRDGVPNVSAYHAGMSDDEKDRVQTSFLADPTAVMVCTSAFGMGVDIPHVATVIHCDVPSSPEEYHQQIGRAGRDGRQAAAFLARNPSDVYRARYKVDHDPNPNAALSRLEHVLAFLEAPRCRLRPILSRFGEDPKDGCGHCDRCIRPVVSTDASGLFASVADAVVDLGDAATPRLLSDYLSGFRSETVESRGLGDDDAFGSVAQTPSAIRHAIRQFLGDGLLTFLETTRGLALTRRGRRCLEGGFPAVVSDGRPAASAVDPVSAVPSSIRAVFAELVDLRRREPELSGLGDAELAEAAAGRMPSAADGRQREILAPFAKHAEEGPAAGGTYVVDLFD